MVASVRFEVKVTGVTLRDVRVEVGEPLTTSRAFVITTR